MHGAAENKACDGVGIGSTSGLGFLPFSTASLVIWLQPHSREGDNNICLRRPLSCICGGGGGGGLTPVPKMPLLPTQKSRGWNGNAVAIGVSHAILPSLSTISRLLILYCKVKAMPLAVGCSCLGNKEKGKSLYVFSADEIFFTFPVLSWLKSQMWNS